MRVVTFLAALAVLPGVLGDPENGMKIDERDMFGFFKWFKKHGKNYLEDEFEHRFNTWKANTAKIKAHNAANKTFTMQMNVFGDMTGEEFKKKYLGLRHVERPFAKKLNIEARKARLGGVENLTAPTSLDWVSKGAVTPVKNQGQCGSCWSFGTTGSLEGALYIKTGTLYSLSEQNLIDCATSYGNNACNGGAVDYAYEYVIDHGICAESDYGYTAKQGICRRFCSKVIEKGELRSYSDVESYNEDALKLALSQQPVAVAIEADHQSFQFYKTGVVTAGDCGTQIDHAVLAVGYGEEPGTWYGSTKYWKVKNSWGEEWGDGGYVKIERQDGKGSIGACGITRQASYPEL